MKKPKRYKKRNVIYEQTEHGSFVDIDEYGMAQQKNAMSERELIKYGYKPTTDSRRGKWDD